MASVNFGSLEWNGTSWGSTTDTSTLTITNHGPCATSQAHIVQITISSGTPGATSVLLGTSSTDGALVLSKDGTVVIPAGFDGTTEVQLVFELSPSNDVAPGSYSFGLNVTVSAAP